MIKNQEHLASELDVPPYIRAKCKMNADHSPTEQLFDLLEAHRADLTVAGLISAFRNIGRKDIVGTIECFIPGMQNEFWFMHRGFVHN